MALDLSQIDTSIVNVYVQKIQYFFWNYDYSKLMVLIPYILFGCVCFFLWLLYKFIQEHE